MKEHSKKKQIVLPIIAAAGLLVLGFVLLLCTSLTMEIQLEGSSNIDLEWGAPYTDAGATATVSSTLFPGMNMHFPIPPANLEALQNTGDVTLRYEASFLWLKCDTTRNVTVVDTVAPVIALTEHPADYALLAGTQYLDPGYRASDNVDGDLTAKVTVSGDIDVNTPGSYTLHYTVTDAQGNTTTVSRTVNVRANLPAQPQDPGDKVIYLTFDDGPSAHTARLLNVLSKYNIKATFFVTNQSTSYVKVMKRIVDEGHTIGIHTYSHNYDYIYANKEQFFEDFNAIRQVIFEQTGVWASLSRFPGGSSSMYGKNVIPAIIRDLDEMGYQYYDWNVSSYDTDKNKTANAVYNSVIAGIQKNGVACVLLHDIRSYSVDAVERIICWGIENGYTFLPLTPSSPVFHQNIG